jgi:hypothetical protein
MAKSKNYISAITRNMSDVQTGAVSIDKLLKASQVGSRGTLGAPSRNSNGLRTSLNYSNVNPKGIQFGKSSSSGSTTTSSGSIWPNMIKQTATGGLASLFGGGGGIGSLVNGLLHLFGGGGKSAPPPLVKFQLPSPQEQTISVGSNGTSGYAGSAIQTTAGAAGSTGVNAGAANSPTLRYQSSEIAQAVKTALLNSSSLNDVISEL